MKKIILLLMFSSLFSSDEFIFLDIEKQLKFEKIRIYIEKLEENNLILSGQGVVYKGSGGNTISSSYDYVYKFEIIQDGKILDEIQFLNTIGLNKEADNYLNDYQIKIEEFKESFIDSTAKFTIWEQPNNTATTSKSYYSIIAEGSSVVGMLVGIFALVVKSPDALLGTFVMLLPSSIPFSHKLRYIKLPPYEQRLTDEQITSLADSYNRKIYKEIKKSDY